MRILDSLVRKIKNSRNQDTIEVLIKTKRGIFRASAPEGGSKGKNEVQGFSSGGIKCSIDFASSLLLKLENNIVFFREFEDLKIIEDEFREVDKTKNLSITGGNTLYAVEAAILKGIAASHQDKELWQYLLDEEIENAGNSNNQKPGMPMQLGNCIGGGKHTRELEKPDFQEFLFLPKTNTFAESFKINQIAYNETYRFLNKKDLKFKGKVTDEKAFITNLNNEQIFSIFQKVREKMRKKLKKTFELGTDVAASSFYDEKNKKYVYANYNGKPRNLTKQEHFDYIFSLIKKYSLKYVEDPFDELDLGSFSKLLIKVKKEKLNTLIAGDDLTCTNLSLLKKAIAKKAINAIIIKPNQVGSLLETKKTLDLARKNKIIPIISHRSGDTNDDTIAHLAVGWQIPIIKIGIKGQERFAKTQKLLEIEKTLKN